jgi:hypothetical protein
MSKEISKQAFDILWKTRENLLKFLTEDVIEKESVLTGKTGYEGALGFEYQEIDNKFMGRLASLNTFLHNLTAGQTAQARKPSIVNRVEIVEAAPEDLSAKINAALKKHASLKLVSTAMKDSEEGKVIVLLAFSSP